jgi:hypothetical protein
LRRISDVIGEKVGRALVSCGVLGPERDLIDWEAVPAMLRAPDGGSLLAAIVFLALPLGDAGGTDRVEQSFQLPNPYCPQAEYDAKVGEALRLIYEERDKFAAAPAAPVSQSGLILGR